MKCKNCGNDLFPGQYRCNQCGHFVETEKKDKPLKEKDKKEELKKL